MVQIFYNGKDAFSGFSPTPLVARQEQMVQYGERWGEQSSFILKGKITGLCGDFNSLISGQQTLLSNFNKDFQSFQIVEDDNIIFDRPYAIVKSVSFDSSNYVGLLPYEVRLECYPEDYFSGRYGVLDPENTIEYTEGKDGLVTITHNVSARGFNTESSYSNALDNARNYVQSISGFNSEVLPAFIAVCPSVCSGWNACLKTVSETVDRFNASYSVVETYVADLTSTGIGTLRYSTDVNSGIKDGITTVDLRGSIEGCRYQTIDEIRTRYNEFDKYSAAVSAYNSITSLINLNPFYLSSGIEEDSLNKKLSFNILFNDDPSPTTYFDYKSDIQTDYLTDITTIDFNGIIRSRGDLKSRWSRVQEFYSGINIFHYVNDAYLGYGISYPLHPHARSSGVMFDSYNAIIEVAASYDNKEAAPSGLDEFNYTISINPAKRQYNAIPLLSGQYTVFNLGYANRASISIDGNAIISPETSVSQGLAIIKSQLGYLSATYGVGTRKTLKKQDISRGNMGQEKEIGFSTQWTYEASEITIP